MSITRLGLSGTPRLVYDEFIGDFARLTDDSYTANSGTVLTVTALLGVLANDEYRCTEFESFDSSFDTAFNGGGGQ